jgi:hypothetical protein
MDLIKLKVVALAGWISRQQEDVIEDLREEVRPLPPGAEPPGIGG